MQVSLTGQPDVRPQETSACRLTFAWLASVESIPFLTAAQKRDILYNNAARFLRLPPDEIARHHRR
jgi:hypothetical protein